MFFAMPAFDHETGEMGAADQFLVFRQLAACRALVVDSENRPRRGHFLPDSPPHGCSMGQETGKKGSGAVDLQPTIPKSDRLLGQNTVARHRAIYQALGDLMSTRIHALSITAYSPEEL
jgi:hypothetical protein